MEYSKWLNEHYKIVEEIIDCMEVGVWITDAKGVVTMVNQYSVRVGGMKRADVLGKSTQELLETGYILRESSVLNAIESRKKESIIQEMGEGGHLIATSIPLFHEGEIDLVICIERDITDVVNLDTLIKKQKALTEKLQRELSLTREAMNINSEAMVACSISSIQLRDRAINMAKVDATVLITGESGTGKEVVATLIQKNSERKDQAYVKVNCAAIPETLLESEFFGYEKGSFTGADTHGRKGLFEQADGGTLFLDEIGELSLPMQTKLLRTLQEKTVRRIGGNKDISVDVRVIAATSKDLKKEMENGRFRTDLYYRLFVLPIHILPLRKRPEDIPPLAYRFLQEFNHQYGLDKTISDKAMHILESYKWPGNVRELRNLIERVVISGGRHEISEFQIKMFLDERSAYEFSDKYSGYLDLPLDEMLSNYEKQLISATLERSKNASEAAQKLKIDKSTMSKKRKKYNL